MKRSEINRIIREFETLLREHQFELPPYLSFTPEQWKEKGHEFDEIRDNGLGWDVTDYGLGTFDQVGLSLITLRNGNPNNPKYRKTYAEKIMMLREGQLSPNHFHWNKMEDIINQGGGTLTFRLWNSTKEGELSEEDVTVYRDGCTYQVPAGSEIHLKPGESLTLYPGCYHEFYVKKGEKSCLIGEVSMCNDDNRDNRFYEPVGRFPVIEEDEPAYRLLCNEYPEAEG